MTPRTTMRIVVAVSTVLLWLAVIIFKPETMERPGSPVEGLFAPFLGWIVVGVFGGLSLLPFVWRRRKDWSHFVIVAAVVTTALIASFYAIASMRHVPYRSIESASTATVCLQGLSIFGCGVALLRVITLQPAPKM